MKSFIQFLSVLVMIVALTACSALGDSASNVNNESQAPRGGTESIRLNEDFDDALMIQSQLAVGTILLEETNLAIDETLAAKLLPLWRAAQSLINSDTAAEVEIAAVFNQIQDSMTPEQIAAIAEMELTQDILATMMEEGHLSTGPGELGGGRADDSGERFSPPEGGFAGGPGGGSPGGRPGGGQGGGLPEGMNPEVLATRQARFAEEGAGRLQERALIMAVVRLLEAKTGENSEDRPQRPSDLAITMVADATGMDAEGIRTQKAEGRTLAQIVEENGGDIEQVRLDLIQALSELPNAQDLDLEQLAADWLGLEEPDR